MPRQVRNLGDIPLVLKIFFLKVWICLRMSGEGWHAPQSPRSNNAPLVRSQIAEFKETQRSHRREGRTRDSALLHKAWETRRTLVMIMITSIQRRLSQVVEVVFGAFRACSRMMDKAIRVTVARGSQRPTRAQHICSRKAQDPPHFEASPPSKLSRSRSRSSIVSRTSSPHQLPLLTTMAAGARLLTPTLSLKRTCELLRRSTRS